MTAGVLFGVYAFPYAQYGVSEAWFAEYLGAYARLVGWVLNLFESGMHVEGATVFGRVTLHIAKSCDAMESKLLFVAAVLAFPAPATRKLPVLALGLCGLTLINVARIVTLYFVLVRNRAAFDFFHLELLPLVMVASTALLFVASTRFMQRPAMAAAMHEPLHVGH